MEGVGKIFLFTESDVADDATFVAVTVTLYVVFNVRGIVVAILVLVNDPVVTCVAPSNTVYV